MVRIYVSTWLGSRAPRYLVNTTVGASGRASSVDWVGLAAIHCPGYPPASWLPDGTEDEQVRICCAEARRSLSCNSVFSSSRLGQQPTRLSWFSGLQTEYLGTLRLHTTCIYIRVHTHVHTQVCAYSLLILFLWRTLLILINCISFMLVWLLLFSCSVGSDSLWPHGLQHTRPPCPSPTPGACSNSCPLSQWCYPTISSSVIPFSSLPQSFPASGSFLVSQLITSGGQSIGVSVSASVLPMNIQDWFPLGWTGLISL